MSVMTLLANRAALSRESGQGKAKIDECHTFRQHFQMAWFFSIPISILEQPISFTDGLQSHLPGINKTTRILGDHQCDGEPKKRRRYFQ
jgi:hypothetical protein